VHQAIKALLSLLIISAAAHADPVLGQSAPSLPAIPRRILPGRDELRSPVPEQPLPPQPSGRVESSQAIQPGPCPLESSDIVTDITEVKFTGPKGAPLSQEIAAILRDVGGVGPGQPIKVVCDIRDRANAALRRARYVASAQIPIQRIENGQIRLEVVTARIVEMRVRGNPGPYEQQLANIIEKLKAIDPLSEEEAEKLLLFAGDMPGLDVQLALMPAGGEQGNLIGNLTVNYVPMSVLGNIQNYNSRLLGRETAYLRTEFYGLTGAADVTYADFSSAFINHNQTVVEAGHQMAVDYRGTAIAARGTYALSRPDVGTLQFKTKSLILGVEMSRPLLRSVLINAGIVGGFEYSQQRTTLSASGISTPLNLDKISALFVRFTGEARELTWTQDEAYRIFGSLELRKGLDILGATTTGEVTDGGYFPSRFEGNAQATILRGQTNASLALLPWLGVAGEFRGQWANTPLLNFDEFSIGNLTIGRGYDPGSNSGDRAAGGSFELHVKAITNAKLKLDFFGFYDAVRLWNLDRNSTEADRRLRSFGGGLRLGLRSTALLELTYARPLDPVLLIDRRRAPDRLLLSLTAQFVPFGMYH